LREKDTFMPIGSYSLVPYIAHQLCEHRPSRILDLGIGFGLYGAVVREWQDLGVQPWSTYLAGVEAWAAYGNPLWDLYNLVVVDTIQNYLSSANEVFDFILMTDVIEHFTKDEGAWVLDAMRDRLSPGGRALVGTPGLFFEQGAAFGNEFECHRSLWTAEDFLTRGFSVILDGEADQFGNRNLLAHWERGTSS
jgi:SAM-dependent methyltransferase